MNIHSYPEMSKLALDDTPRRQAILAAALRLFAEKGYHGTAVPEIAERAGVGAGTVYRYFESKEALVNALYQHWKTEYGRALMAGLPLDAPVRRVFRALWVGMCRFARDNPDVMKFLELHHHRSYLDAESRQTELRILEPIHAFVKNAQEQQVLKRGSAELMMAIVYGGFLGLLRAAEDGFIDLNDAAVDEAEQCVWEAIRS
jgi:AcrR family transcriptional regulator